MKRREPYRTGQRVRAHTICGEIDALVTADDGGRRVQVGWVEADGGLAAPRVYEQGVDHHHVRASA